MEIVGLDISQKDLADRDGGSRLLPSQTAERHFRKYCIFPYRIFLHIKKKMPIALKEKQLNYHINKEIILTN